MIDTRDRFEEWAKTKGYRLGRKGDGYSTEYTQRAWLGFQAALASQGADARPVAMVLHCPNCSALHVDEGEWATRSHKTHQCQNCMHEWRPFEYATVGVSAMPVAFYDPNDDNRQESFVWASDYPNGAGSSNVPLYATRDAAPSNAAVTALKWIKVLVCGDSAPRWNNAHQTAISRGMIADIIDKAIAAIAPRNET